MYFDFGKLHFLVLFLIMHRYPGLKSRLSLFHFILHASKHLSYIEPQSTSHNILYGSYVDLHAILMYPRRHTANMLQDLKDSLYSLTG